MCKETRSRVISLLYEFFVCRLLGGFFILKFYKLRGDFSGNSVNWGFKLFFCFHELFSDGDVLGTVLLAFAAADAVCDRCRSFSQRSAHNMLLHSREPSLGILAVIMGERPRNVHIFRTRHTVAAACASDLHF